MNIVADENVDGQIVERLRADGYSVLSIAGCDPGIADEKVLSHSRELNALLITGDKDFGELVFRQALLHSGVLLVRLAGHSPQRKADIIANVLACHATAMTRAFSVLTQRYLRIRNHPDDLRLAILLPAESDE